MHADSVYMTSFPFVQAANYTRGRLPNRPLRFIVMHDMEYAEGPQTAESVANFFHNQPVGNNGSSAHVCCDRDSVVGCVHWTDTAWGAPSVNADGFHIEQAGFASMTRGQWLADDAMLNISSCVAAQAIALFNFLGHGSGVQFEARRLTVDEIRNRSAYGIIGHADATAAFTPGGHTDPGSGFPWDVFIAKVQWWLPHISDIRIS